MRTLQFSGFSGSYTRSDYIINTEYRIKSFSKQTYPVSLESTKASITQEVNPSIQQTAILPKSDYFLAVNGAILEAIPSSTQNNSHSVVYIKETIRRIQEIFKSTKKKFFSKLDGDFSICLFDFDTQNLYLYRSLCATDSLYYTEQNNSIYWSTNPLNLLSNIGLKDIDTEILSSIVATGHIDPTRSCYKALKRCPAGYLLTANYQGISLEKIQDFRPIEIKAAPSLQEIGIKIREILDAKTQIQFKGIQRAGVFLSGGIDSAAVTGAIKRAGVDVIGLHWSSKGYPPGDESFFAEKIAQHLQIPLLHIPILDTIKSQSKYLEFEFLQSLPFNHGYLKWFERLAKTARFEGIDILASGHLGDNIFDGDLSEIGDALRVSPVLGMRMLFELLGLNINFSTKQLLKMSLAKAKNIPTILSTGAADRLERIAPILTPNSINAAKSYGSFCYQTNEFPTLSSKIAYNFIKVGIEEERETALKLDILAPNGIRLIHPLADPTLINFALSLPPGCRTLPYAGEIISKAAWRVANANLLPVDTISTNRDFRVGYAGITELFCLNNIENLKSLLSKDAILCELGIVDHKKTTTVLNDLKKTPNIMMGLENMVMVELWLRDIASFH